MTLKHNTTKQFSVYLNIEWNTSPLLPSVTSHLCHTKPLVYMCSSGPGVRKRSCSWWQLRKVREVSEVLRRLLQVWCSLKV